MSMRCRAPLKRDVDAVVPQALAAQAVADADRVHQIDRALLEHAGAHALDHVVPAAVLDDDRIDAVQVQQVAEHQPGGSGADDADLCAYGLHDRIPRDIMTEKSDVVGSLLRPRYLLDARDSLERGDLTPAEFKRIEDRAVDEAIALQEAAGLDVVTDGEMRRYAFYGHLVEALEGFDKRSGWSITFRDGQGHEAALERPLVVEQAHVAPPDERRGVHLPARPDVAAGQGHAHQRAAGGRVLRPRQITRRVPTRDAYLADLVDFTRREIEELRRLGCDYVQIDAPQYAALLDETIREGYRQRGHDPTRCSTRASISTTPIPAIMNSLLAKDNVDAAGAWWSREAHARRRPYLAARGRIARPCAGDGLEAEGFTEVEGGALQVSPATRRISIARFCHPLYLVRSERNRSLLTLSPYFARVCAEEAAGGRRERKRIVIDFGPACSKQSRAQRPDNHPEFTLRRYRASEDYGRIMDDWRRHPCCGGAKPLVPRP